MQLRQKLGGWAYLLLVHTRSVRAGVTWEAAAAGYSNVPLLCFVTGNM